MTRARFLFALMLAPALALAQNLPSPVFKQMQVTDGTNTTTYTGSACSGPGCATGASLTSPNVFTQPQTMPSVIVTDGNGTGTYTADAFTNAGTHYPGWQSPHVLNLSGNESTMGAWGVRCNRLPNAGTGTSGNTVKCLWGYEQTYELSALYEWPVTGEVHNYTFGFEGAQQVGVAGNAFVEHPRLALTVTAVTGSAGFATYTYTTGAYTIPAGDSVIVTGTGVGADCTGSGTPACLVTSVGTNTFTIASSYVGSASGLTASAIDDSVSQTFGVFGQVNVNNSENNPTHQQINQPCTINLLDNGGPTTDSHNKRVGCQGTLTGATGDQAFTFGFSGTQRTSGSGAGPRWNNWFYVSGNYAEGLNFSAASTGVPMVELQANQFQIWDAAASSPSSYAPYSGSCAGGSGSNRCSYYNGSVWGYYTPGVTGGPAMAVSDAGGLTWAGNVPFIPVVCLGTDDTQAIANALAQGNDIFLVTALSTCRITNISTQLQLATQQRVHGASMNTPGITIDSGYSTTSPAVFLVAPGSADTGPTVEDLFAAFAQNAQVTKTVVTGTSSGGTTITVSSATGLINGDYVLDSTTAASIPAETTYTFTGTGPYTLTLSNAVGSGGVIAGDTLKFNRSRANTRPLGSCSNATGGYGCQYPPMVMAKTSNERVKVSHVHCEGAWICFDFTGGSNTLASASSGATSLNVVNSAAFTVGYVINDIDTWGALSSTTTVTGITDATHITISPAVVGTVALGDQIAQTNNVAPTVETVETGTAYLDMRIDGCRDFSHIANHHAWGWGWNGGAAINQDGVSQFSDILHDGVRKALQMGRCDGMSARDQAYENARFVITPNASLSVSPSDYAGVKLDGAGSSLEIAGGTFNNIVGMYHNGKQNGSTCAITVTGGRTQITALYTPALPDSNTVPMTCVNSSSGATTLLNVQGGTIKMSNPSVAVMSVTGGNTAWATLSTNDLTFYPPSTSNAPFITQTGSNANLIAKGDSCHQTSSAGTNNLFIRVATDATSNIVTADNICPGLANSFPASTSPLGYYAAFVPMNVPPADSQSLGMGVGALTDPPTTAGTYNNLAVGFGAMGANMSANATNQGVHNTAIGVNALPSLTTGNNNTAAGNASLNALSTGTGNTAVGQGAGGGITGGNNNTVIGLAAMHLSTGSTNTVVGQGSLSAATSGGSNTIVGAELANSVCITCSQNIIIGYGAQGLDTPASNTSQYLNIGGVIVATGIGTPSTSTLTFPGNIVIDGTCTGCTAGGGGTVTSVGFSDASTTPIYSISGSPVTTSGTLTQTLSTQSANTVFAGPSSGSAAQPAFRALVAADVPTLNQNTTGNAATATSATTATNLAGGAAGSVPYQTGSGATSPLAIGTAGQVLDVNAGATAPQWVAQSSLAVGTATNLAGGAAGSLPQQTGSGATSLLAIGTAGQVPTVNSGATALAYATPTFDVMFGSASITSGTTDYLAPGVVNTSNAAGAICPRNLHFTSLNFAQTTAAATTGTTVTLYVGTAGGSLSATSMTCTTSATGKTCSDTSHSVACTAGQGWSIQENVAGTEANTGLNMFGLSTTAP